MLSKHGSLESIILSALWNLENEGVYTNSVKDVYNVIKNGNCEDRAYTTIKTVMDRLYEKKALLRFKQGRKFFYRTAFSNNEIVINSLQEVANRYCGGDLSKLSKILNSLNENKELISA